MGTSLGDLYYTLDVDTKDFISKLNSAEATAEDVNKSLDKMVKSASEVGDKLSKNLTLPIVALGTAAVAMAASAENSANRFKKVFVDDMGSANEAITNLTTNYGMSTDEAQKFMSSTGQLAKSLGASTTQAASMAEQLTALSVDIAASSGGTIDAAAAHDILNKALTGQTKGMKELGYAITTEDVQTQMAKDGTDKLTGSALKLATAQASLKVVTDATADAQGGFQKNSDSLSQKLNETGDSIHDVMVSLGNSLLPVIKEITDNVKIALDGFNNLGDGNKQLVVTVLAVTAAIGPAIKAITAIKTAITLLNTTALAGPLGIVALLGAAAVAVVAFSNAQEDAYKKRHKDLFEYDAGTSIQDNIAKYKAMEQTIQGIYNRLAELKKLSSGPSAEATALQAQLKGLLADHQAMKQSIQDYYDQQKKVTAASEAQKKKEDELAASEVAKKKIADQYADSRKDVVDILEKEKTEVDKLLDQIAELQKTPWAKGQLETDRLNAIAALRNQIDDLIKDEQDAAVQKIKDNATERASTRKTVADEYSQYEDYYAMLADANLDRIKDLETQRDKAIAAAQKEGQDTLSIETNYDGQIDSIREQMKQTELARVTTLKAQTDAYYQNLTTQYQTQLTQIETKKQTEIADAQDKGLSISTIEAGYNAQAEAVRQAMQDSEKARVAEIDTINTAYYTKLGELTGNRLTQLEAERAKAVEQATAQGLDISVINAAYDALEEQAKTQMAADDQARRDAEIAAEEEKVAKKTEFEQGYQDKIDQLTMSKLDLIYKERDEAIAAAEKQGYDTQVIKDYYALKEQEQRDADAAAEQAKTDKIAALQQDYYLKLEGLHGNEIAKIEAERDAAIAAAEKEGADTTLIKQYYTELEEKAVADAAAKERKEAEETAKKKQELALTYITTFTGYAQTMLSTLASMWDEIDTSQKNAIDEQTKATLAGIDAQIRALEAKADTQEGLTEDEKKQLIDLQNSELKTKYNGEVQKYNIEKDAFNRNQAIQYSQIAISTALAIVQGYAQLGPIAGTVAAIALAAIGAAQAAVVYNQPQPVAPTKPAYASGGTIAFSQGGYVQSGSGINAVIGEGSYDEVVLPLSDKVFSKLGSKILENLQGTTKTVSSGQLNQTIQVVMDGKVLYSVVNNGLVNRSIRVPSAAII